MPQTKVLIVEDESIVALDLHHRLKGLGYTVTALASSGEEALQRIAEVQPDVVLMDIRLTGGRDGIEAADQIRTRFSIPVIFLTAHSDPNTLERAKHAQPYGYLVKPFVDTDLTTTIEMAVYKHALDQREQEYIRRLEREMADRQRAEEALRESEETLRSLIEQSVDGVILLNGEGHILEWNPGMEYITGLQRADMLGIPVWEAPWFTSAPASSDLDVRVYIQDNMQLFNDTGQTPWLDRAHELVIQHPDGALRHVEYCAFPINTRKDNMTGVIARDVTERKRTEQQAQNLALEQERAQLLRGFITDASHEFRTPLSVIGTSAYLLRHAADEARKVAYWSDITLHVRHLTQLIDAILLMIQLDSGTKLDLETLDVNALLGPMHVRHNRDAEERRLTLALDLADDLPPIQGDAHRLDHAFHQIVDNALKHTPPGGIVTIRTACDRGHVRVEILDTGCGMTAEQTQHIFERFYRGDAAHTTRGLGLGLTIAKTVVELHQGQIEVDTSPGAGSTFRILLPVGLMNSAPSPLAHGDTGFGMPGKASWTAPPRDPGGTASDRTSPDVEDPSCTLQRNGDAIHPYFAAQPTG